MWTLPRKVRDILGLDDESSITDRELTELILMASEQVREDVYDYHMETLGVNPSTGAGWDGQNTMFQTLCYPIMDTDYDNTVTSSDVSVDWIDSSYSVSSCSVSITNATYGILDVTQQGGDPVPADAYDVIVHYHSCSRSMTLTQLEDLTSLLAAHLVMMRLKSGTSISSVDLQSDWKILLRSPSQYLEAYRLKVSRLQSDTIRGV